MGVGLNEPTVFICSLHARTPLTIPFPPLCSKTLTVMYRSVQICDKPPRCSRGNYCICLHNLNNKHCAKTVRPIRLNTVNAPHEQAKLAGRMARHPASKPLASVSIPHWPRFTYPTHRPTFPILKSETIFVFNMQVLALGSTPARIVSDTYSFGGFSKAVFDEIFGR